MRDTTLLGPWIRRFLLEYLIDERNLARNTQHGYRDTLRQILPFVSNKMDKPVDRLTVTDISAQLVRDFLLHIETVRGCCIATRNQRLACIHALARFIGGHSPEHIEWCTQVRYVPFKKTARPNVPYLDKVEMDALLAAPDQSTAQGRRDHALLLFLYNSGARADEAAHLPIGNVDLHDHSVRLNGKGGKQRLCPLWPNTIAELAAIVAQRPPQEYVFLNRCGRPITRFGIHTLVERYAEIIKASMPSLAAKRISPHSIRHSTASHLLHAGVDINTVRAWLGHVSLDTTNIYAEIDLEGKAKALAKCEIKEKNMATRRWTSDPELMAFLRSL